MSPRDRSWYPLDNSAKIFPAIKTGKVSAVFRIAIDLTEDILPVRLQQALVDILPRFQAFTSRLRPGLFWYYLEPNKASLQVYEDTHYPCRRLYRKNNNGYLFRVLYYRHTISLEVFHSLTDGTGALSFLKTLAARYLNLGGADIPAEEGVLDRLEIPPAEEMEDSYRRNARPTSRHEPKMPAAYHIKGVLEPSGRIHIIRADVDLAALKREASRHKVTVNDYLVATYIHAFCQLQRAEERNPRRPVVIAVPVNMRRYYASRTLRNFFLRVHPSVHQGYGDFTFEEILSEVHHFMKVRTNEKYLNVQMANNLRNEQILAARLIPLLLKNPILKFAYLFYGDSRHTSTLTNVGVVRLPEAMMPYVRGFHVLMGPSLYNWINCSAVSFENTLTLTFSRRIREPLVERLFLTHLVRQGIPVKVTSNQELPTDQSAIGS